MPDIKKRNLIFHTVRHMTPRQWTGRVLHTLRGKLPAPPVRIPKLTECYPLGMGYAHPQPTDPADADRILNNEFPTVSGQWVSFGKQIDWDMPGTAYRLACFNLNSFAWLELLSDAYAQTHDRVYLEKGFQLIRQWQAQCGKKARGDKWDAYVTSKRILHQMGFLSKYAGQKLGEYVPFLAAQAKVLSRRIEFHLGANHVLREAAALMYCGAFVQDEKLYRKSKKLLFAQIKEQFLPDGGHYERSVSYHVESLQQCYEALWLMFRWGDPEAGTLRDLLRSPYIFLNAMLRCDGTIPLVNDAAADYPFDAADFLYTAAYLYTDAPPMGVPGPYSRRWALAAPKASISWDAPTLFEATGFLSHHFELEGIGHSLFFDAGDNGPDYNLGHTHADSLSLLWTTSHGEVFADSGVYTYAPGNFRNACRATAAHNTVEVDGISSSQVWGAFRTAKRAYTHVESFSFRDGVLSVTASHDGYRKVLADPVTHRRQLSLDHVTGLLAVTDTLLPHREAHTGVLRFHLAPGCSAVPVSDRSLLLQERYLLSCSEALTLESCFVAKDFGVQQESLCVTAKFPIRGKTKVQTTVSLLPL